jgi:pSer/pThr/pTyr-binding forkhead associated (FHA) protein
VVNGDTGLYLEDLGSTNGTYVNGRRITAPTSVGTEDEIRIGRTILKLEP